MKNKLILILAVLSLMFIIACGNKENIKIGFIGPLTGDVAIIGNAAKVATELAVEEINQEGGINGRMIEVIFEDGKCGPKDSAVGANKLVNIDKVSVIVGGGCSSETLAAAPIAEESRVPLISYCSSNPKITEAGDYIFRVYPSDTFQGKVAAEIAFKDLGSKKAAILYCLSDYCMGIKDVFKKNFGGEIVAEEGYEQSSRDLRTQIAKIKDANPDLIYFSGYTEATIVGLKQIKELGIDVPLLGGDSWDDPKTWESVGEAGEGARYLTAYSPENDAFKIKIIGRTGSNEIPVCGPQSYDIVYLVANILKKVGTEGEKIKDELYKIKDYNGVSGVITIDKNGDLEGGSYITKIVKNGKAIVE